MNWGGSICVIRGPTTTTTCHPYVKLTRPASSHLPSSPPLIVIVPLIRFAHSTIIRRPPPEPTHIFTCCSAIIDPPNADDLPPLIPKVAVPSLATSYTVCTVRPRPPAISAPRQHRFLSVSKLIPPIVTSHISNTLVPSSSHAEKLEGHVLTLQQPFLPHPVSDLTSIGPIAHRQFKRQIWGITVADAHIV